MLIIGCSGSKKLAKKTAKKLRASYSELLVETFPDHELRVRFKTGLRGKEVVLVQSFFGNISDKITEVLFAAYTARELGAKKVSLVAPYFPYLREDKRFEKGEAVSARIIAKIFSIFDMIFIIDPHLHRFKSLGETFENAYRLTAAKEITDYIKSHVKDPLIVGPDAESFQWAENVASLLGTEAMVLKKKRHTPSKVEINTAPLEKIKGRNVVVVDDIISTGKTMLEVLKNLKQLKAKNIYCICVHGIFASNALNLLKKHAKIVSCNTIPSQAAKIDVLPEIVSALKNTRAYDQKDRAALKAMEWVKPGMVIGLGSGTTVIEFVKMLAKNTPNVKVVPSSEQIERVAKTHGLKTVKNQKPDLVVDGADEIDHNLNMLKGLGAFAFVSEKRLDYSAKPIIIADKTKLKKKLGKDVLVEIKSNKARKELEKLGCRITRELKLHSRHILFLRFAHSFNPKDMEKRINKIQGVIDNGIFANFHKKPVVIIGYNKKAEVLR